MMQWQKDQAAEILDEMHERQEDLKRTAEENKADDWTRTGILVGSYVLIQLVTNFLRIREFGHAMGAGLRGMVTSSRRAQQRREMESDNPWTNSPMNRANVIPLM